MLCRVASLHKTRDYETTLRVAERQNNNDIIIIILSNKR